MNKQQGQSRRFFGVSRFALIVCMSVAILMHHCGKAQATGKIDSNEESLIRTARNVDRYDDEDESRKSYRYVDESDEGMSRPYDVGFMHVYLRESDDRSDRDEARRFRFPVARYRYGRLALSGPFVRFQSKARIFEHRRTRQTVIGSSRGFYYIFPKLFNVKGRSFSLAERLAAGRASFRRNAFGTVLHGDIATFFHPWELKGSGAPRIDAYTGSFTDGVDTRFRWPTKSRRSGKTVKRLKDDSEQSDDGESSNYDRAAYSRRRSRPRTRYFKAGWSSTGSMAFARIYHTASLLKSGSVLVVGGSDGNIPLRSVELYDPATEMWTIVGPLRGARGFHTTSVLPDGSILAAGGSDGVIGLRTAEVYNPSTRTWRDVGSMTYFRAFHTATVLKDGSVLVAGGSGDTDALNTAEVYDSSTETWKTVGDMTHARGLHTATLLEDGTVLVAGGSALVPGGMRNETMSFNTAELYDPVSQTWTPTGNMIYVRDEHTASLLKDGSVLVAGGSNRVAALNTAEVYNPWTKTWRVVGSLAYARAVFTASTLFNGSILVKGGLGNGGFPGMVIVLDTAELYDQSTEKWTTVDRMTEARVYHTASRLFSGSVLVAGGANSTNPLNTAELFSPAGGVRATVGQLNFIQLYSKASKQDKKSARGMVCLNGAASFEP